MEPFPPEPKPELLFNPDEVKSVDENNIANFSDINLENTVKPDEATSAEPGKKPEKFNRKKQIMGIGAGSLAVIVGVSIGIASLNRKPKPTETEITETTNSETQETEVGWWELDWAKQSAELQRLNNLSIEEFRNESLENQLLYYSFLNDVYYNQFHSDDYANNYNEGMIFPTNKTASLDDSAQKIMDLEKNKVLLANYAVDEDGNFDSTEARKILSILYYDFNSLIDPDNGVTIAEELDKKFSEIPQGREWAEVASVESLTQTARNKTEIMYEEDGTPYVYLDITESGHNSTIKLRFIIFINYQGESQSIWQS